jgi:hypothetical protein
MKSNLVNLTYEIEIQADEDLVLPEALIKALSAGRWPITIQPLASEAPIRDHTAFLNSYAPEDEGLYDDYSPR